MVAVCQLVFTPHTGRSKVLAVWHACRAALSTMCSNVYILSQSPTAFDLHHMLLAVIQAHDIHGSLAATLLQRYTPGNPYGPPTWWFIPGMEDDHRASNSGSDSEVGEDEGCVGLCGNHYSCDCCCRPKFCWYCHVSKQEAQEVLVGPLPVPRSCSAAQGGIWWLWGNSPGDPPPVKQHKQQRRQRRQRQRLQRGSRQQLEEGWCGCPITHQQDARRADAARRQCVPVAVSVQSRDVVEALEDVDSGFC